MTNTSRNTIVGLFEDQRSAQQVIDELIQNGFTRDQVHLESAEGYAGAATSGGAGLTGRAPSERHGGFTGWLSSLFGTDEADDESNRYAEAVQRGSCIVAVDAQGDNRDRAVDIMNSYGAIDIDQHAAKHGYGGTASTGTAELPAVTDKGAGPIPVVEEELQVGKRSVQRGGVRVYSRVVEQPVEQDVQLREEKVTVDRRPVNRPVNDADQATLRDQTIEVKEMAEEPVISKQARVVEEVRIGKESTQRTEKVRDTVRRTEVETENLGTGREPKYAGNARTGDRGAEAETSYDDYSRTGNFGTSGAANYADDFRSDFQTRYSSSGASYESYAPAYEFGSRMAGDPRYKGKNWNDVESTLKTDYLRNNPNSTWDQTKGAVRYGWEKVTGQR